MIALSTAVCCGCSAHSGASSNATEDSSKAEPNTPTSDNLSSDNDVQDAGFAPDISKYSAGDIIGEENPPDNINECFISCEITVGDNIYERIIGKSYIENDNISLDDLRYIKLIHYNFEHQIQVGEIIVNKDICEDTISIFRELFDAEYEIQSLRLVDDFWQGDGDSTDVASMSSNNSSCFCYREITSGSRLSNHAYGLAIDINPLQNPYVRYDDDKLFFTPDNAGAYIDRDVNDPHIITKGDLCYSIFEKYGFTWGGDWTTPIDYQHFEKSQ